ncbi:ankyrin repeat domain-containing protein [Nonomuraea sp. NPDC050310]|uniref:ankyrin repeat domain-containing protein n=1 Tax=unclassified Nonomuraea TaxID=2593643 RepID=UPI0033C26A33
MHEEELYQAALSGDLTKVRGLLERGADPNQPVEEGLPLCAAAAWDRLDVIAALLEGGAEVAAREADGWHPLMWAAANGNADAAHALIEAGAPVDEPSEGGETPLTLAARRGALGAVRVLLDAGADPEKADGDGDTPLDIASAWVGVHLETALLDQIGQEGWEYVVTRQFAKDGTELVTVHGRSAEGDSEQVQAQRGHAAVATLLEDATGLYTPVAQLVARALAHRDVDEDAETWWVVADSLGRRAGTSDAEETYEALSTLCVSEDAREREFGVDAIAQFGVTEDGDKPYRERTLPLLQKMATTEGNPQVLRSVLSALGHQGDPRALPQVLEIIGRPGHKRTMTDAIALADVLPPDGGEGLELLIEMTADESDEVRDWATAGLANQAADTPAIREALAARLDDSDLHTVAEASRGLAQRGDARAEAGIKRVLAESDDPYDRELAVEAQAQLGA